jgi:hypothetical protein
MQEILDLIQSRGDKDPLDFLSEVISANDQYSAELKVQASNVLTPYLHSKVGSTPAARFIPEKISVPESRSITEAENYLAHNTDPLPEGISTGDFAEALSALLGPNAGGLSASTIVRLKEVWADEHARWLKRDFSVKRYVYFWADGIYVQARLEDEAQCLLVIIGATPEGKKEPI